MKYIDAVYDYINYLKSRHYTNDTIRLKNAVLTNWFSYALAMVHPDSITEIRRIKKPAFFNNQRLYTNTNAKKIKRVKHFLEKINDDDNIIYLNLKTFYDNYREHFLKSDSLSLL